MRTIAETPTFTRQADKLFSEDDRRELIEPSGRKSLGGRRDSGDEGVRKLRFATLGRGKRGGARVICFYGGEHMPIHALLACSKSARTDSSPAQRRAVATLVEAIKSAGKERK